MSGIKFKVFGVGWTLLKDFRGLSRALHLVFTLGELFMGIVGLLGAWEPFVHERWNFVDGDGWEHWGLWRQSSNTCWTFFLLLGFFEVWGDKFFGSGRFLRGLWGGDFEGGLGGVFRGFLDTFGHWLTREHNR